MKFEQRQGPFFPYQEHRFENAAGRFEGMMDSNGGDKQFHGAVRFSTRVPAQTLANPIARRPNISESHSQTRVLEYPFSAPFLYTKGYLRVQGRACWSPAAAARYSEAAQGSRPRTAAPAACALACPRPLPQTAWRTGRCSDRARTAQARSATAACVRV